MTQTQRRARIVVIDDDATFVELMEELLALGEGYDVLSSTHWPNSVEFIRAARPDLIILDLMMGRAQHGRAVLELLRDDPLTAAVPVILCSAAAPTLLDQARRLRAKGAVETLAKPFELDDLLDTIERLLATSGASAV
jgi:CheY-like chemotaxis protein